MAETNIRAIVTHERPHLDEITAIWLLKKFGEEKFPGVSQAQISFLDTGGNMPDGVLAERYGQKGILLVGIGGGRFDEHPLNGQARKEGECATTLVAKDLGLDDDPVLEKIIKFVLSSDLTGRGNPFDLAGLVKSLSGRHSSQDVIQWATTALEVRYQEQLDFLTTTKEEFLAKAQIEEFLGPGKRTLNMVTIVSDSEQMNKFARSEHGGQMAVIIQQQPTGNVQIYTNRIYGLVLYDVAQMLRLEEQQLKGQMLTTDWKALSGEGKVLGVEEWFFHHGAQMLLNGSLTAKSVPPTRIPLEKIREIVRIGVSPACFEPGRADKCSRGECSSTRTDPCLWYPWGLHRCRKIRHDAKS